MTIKGLLELPSWFWILAIGFVATVIGENIRKHRVRAAELIVAKRIIADERARQAREG